MAEMIKELDARQDELVIKSHAELLQRGVAQVKRITPILISSIKLFLNTSQQSKLSHLIILTDRFIINCLCHLIFRIDSF